MQKDYWNICKRNCVAMSVLSTLALFILLLLPKKSVILLAVVVIVAVVWIVLGRMFSKRSPKAIMVAYIFMGLSLALMLVANILNPSSFGISNILSYLIYVYLLQCVYKAQKQTVVSVV